MDLMKFKINMLEYISDNFDVDVDDIDDDTPLFSSTLLDSFGLIDLVSYIEQEAMLKVETLDMHLENFDAIEKIQAFVARKKGL